MLSGRKVMGVSCQALLSSGMESGGQDVGVHHIGLVCSVLGQWGPRIRVKGTEGRDRGETH